MPESPREGDKAEQFPEQTSPLPAQTAPYSDNIMTVSVSAVAGADNVIRVRSQDGSAQERRNENISLHSSTQDDSPASTVSTKESQDKEASVESSKYLEPRGRTMERGRVPKRSQSEDAPAEGQSSNPLRRVSSNINSLATRGTSAIRDILPSSRKERKRVEEEERVRAINDEEERKKIIAEAQTPARRMRRGSDGSPVEISNLGHVAVVRSLHVTNADPRSEDDMPGYFAPLPSLGAVLSPGDAPRIITTPPSAQDEQPLERVLDTSLPVAASASTIGASEVPPVRRRVAFAEVDQVHVISSQSSAISELQNSISSRQELPRVLLAGVRPEQGGAHTQPVGPTPRQLALWTEDELQASHAEIAAVPAVPAVPAATGTPGYVAALRRQWYANAYTSMGMEEPVLPENTAVYTRKARTRPGQSIEEGATGTDSGAQADEAEEQEGGDEDEDDDDEQQLEDEEAAGKGKGKSNIDTAF